MTPDAKTPPEPRPAISRMQPYEWEPPSAAIARQAGVPEDQVVRFDTNTFPWPGAAVDRLAPEPLNEYPDTSYRGLTDAIAGYTGVSADHVTVGAGADEVLDLIAKAYIDGSAAALISRPTYPMFTVLTEMAGGTIDAVPAVDLRVDRQPFLDRARRARLTWLSNPNNPTGELLPFDYVEALAGITAGILVLDEAYYEMSGVTGLPLIDRMPNVVVVRTLSKAFGLAGARVGYALAGPAISEALRRVRPPGSISVLSAALAVHSLTDLKGMRESGWSASQANGPGCNSSLPDSASRCVNRPPTSCWFEQVVSLHRSYSVQAWSSGPSRPARCWPTSSGSRSASRRRTIV